MAEEGKAKSGFAAIIGRPNVGKSTLLNQLVGQKVAIISDKPQTTRNQIRGILTTERGQVVFIDTPGIHKPRNRLGEYMVETARRALEEVDVILYVVDAAAEPGKGEQVILQYLQEVSTPVVLVVNKIDLVKRGEWHEVAEFFKAQRDFAEVVPVSAVRGDNLEQLKEAIFSRLPEGPWFYAPDMVTDQPERLVIAELIREKVLLLTREEIPYSVAVDIEEIAPRSPELLYVRAVIYTERDSQKGILIGRDGRMLKEVGKLAREELENLLGTRLYLDLWVKVKKDWRDNESYLRSLGYTYR